MILLKRSLISSRAWSQVMRCHACVGTGLCPVRAERSSAGSQEGPFGFTRLIGYSTLSGEYTRSRYLATFAHKNPRVTGCAGSPCIFVALPSSTVIRTPQASGQSWGHAAWTTFFTMLRLYGGG